MRYQVVQCIPSDRIDCAKPYINKEGDDVVEADSFEISPHGPVIFLIDGNPVATYAHWVWVAPAKESK